MADPLVTANDVQVRLLNRVLSESELATVQVWIDDLLAQVRARIASFDELVSDPNYVDTLKLVIYSTIKRVLDNPRGLRQMSVSIDDYTRAETVDSSGSAGKLAISDDDWALLLPALAGDAFSIRSSGEPDTGRRWFTTDGWIS